MSASGIHVHLKNIPGVGRVRTRYPIMPIHDAGNTIYRELYALKEMALKPLRYQALYPTVKENNGTVERVKSFYIYHSFVLYESIN